jgi:hypothetical protein
MKTKPAIGAKQTAQKSRVMYAEHTLRRPLESTNTLRFTDVGAHDHCIPVAVIPCQSLKQARQRVKFERMGWEEKDRAIRDAMASGGDWSYGRQPLVADLSRAVLLALGHAPEGGTRK